MAVFTLQAGIWGLGNLPNSFFPGVVEGFPAHISGVRSRSLRSLQPIPFCDFISDPEAAQASDPSFSLYTMGSAALMERSDLELEHLHPLLYPLLASLTAMAWNQSGSIPTLC